MKQTLRDRFLFDAKYTGSPTVVVVAVKLPTGAIETIVNTQMLADKMDYYLSAYDSDFKLKANENIQIVGYMIA